MSNLKDSVNLLLDKHNLAHLTEDVYGTTELRGVTGVQRTIGIRKGVLV